LNDGLNNLPLGYGLQQRDLAGQGRNKIFMFYPQCHRITRGIGNFAEEFMTGAVQHGYLFAAPYAEHVQRMVRLAFIELEHGVTTAFGRQVKTVHK
jgi:hypothetical protein